MNQPTDPTSPGFLDIDAWGLSHRGNVRTENQDCFFLGAISSDDGAVRVVPFDESDTVAATTVRLASLGVVADGVGGVTGGREAARVAVNDLVAAVADFFQDGRITGTADAEQVSRHLQDAALLCHEALVQRARDAGGGQRFATTLTLFLGLWPHAYLLQVGDSRCYVFENGRLTQISRDQTMAEDLVDRGILSRTMAEQSRWANVLSSAIGGEQTVPVVTRVVRTWGTVVFLCSDGLTKHVSDGRISERLAAMTGCREVAEQLLEDALDDGGTDNITIVLGRTLEGGKGGAA
jgi:protein phosphatase